MTQEVKVKLVLSRNNGKKIMYHKKVVFIPGMQSWFNKWKLTNVIQYSNKIKGEIYMIISIDAGKASDKM